MLDGLGLSRGSLLRLRDSRRLRGPGFLPTTASRRRVVRAACGAVRVRLYGKNAVDVRLQRTLRERTCRPRWRLRCRRGRGLARRLAAHDGHAVPRGVHPRASRGPPWPGRRSAPGSHADGDAAGGAPLPRPAPDAWHPRHGLARLPVVVRMRRGRCVGARSPRWVFSLETARWSALPAPRRTALEPNERIVLSFRRAHRHAPTTSDPRPRFPWPGRRDESEVAERRGDRPHGEGDRGRGSVPEER